MSLTLEEVSHGSINNSSQFVTFKLLFTGEVGPPEESSGTRRRAKGTHVHCNTHLANVAFVLAIGLALIGIHTD